MHQRFVIAILACFTGLMLHAQDLEPRAYANVPKGTNVAALAYAYSSGNVLTDPSLPIENFKMKANSIGGAYVRTFALFNKLARVQAILPYTFLAGSAKFNGRDTSAARNGFGDARVRLGINFIGSPALDKKDFRTYQQKMIVGASIVISIPTGLYYSDKRINLGSNRWAIKPEIGISKRFKRIYAEAYTGIWFYTNNKEFLVSKTLEQKPVLSLQAHASYHFKNQMWVGMNLNWFNGGETIVNDAPVGDLKDNWRIGATWSVPVAKQHSFKLQFHVGAFTNSGYDYNLISLGYQYIFF